MLENSSNSAFKAKFRDRCQLVQKNGVISLGVHVVSKKELPLHKSHQDCSQEARNLNKTIIHGLGLAESSQSLLQNTSLSNLKLPILRQARRKIPDQEFDPMNEKRGINRSYSRKHQASFDSFQKKLGLQEEVIESKLNRSVILKH